MIQYNIHMIIQHTYNIILWIFKMVRLSRNAWTLYLITEQFYWGFDTTCFESLVFELLVFESRVLNHVTAANK